MAPPMSPARSAKSCIPNLAVYHLSCITFVFCILFMNVETLGQVC